VVPGGGPEAVTNKTGMSFNFMGIMLATARSIKDSDCGLAAADRPDVLGCNGLPTGRWSGRCKAFLEHSREVLAEFFRSAGNILRGSFLYVSEQ
jgi:hypothetical protein